MRTSVPKNAFTLIEMLVVIAIIAVLAALLFPVFARARSQSKKDVCLSNLRQLGQAVVMYAADYDEHIPYAPSPVSKGILSANGSLFGEPTDTLVKVLPDVRTALQPYKTTPALFHCPLDQFYSRQGKQKPTWFEEFGSSYEYDDKHALKVWSLAAYPAAANNLLFWDEEYFHGGSSGQDGLLGAVFVDTHAKTITWQQRTEALTAVP